MLCFWDDHFDWSLVHIGGCYDFTNARISEQSFEEITGADFVYNITPPEAKAKVFKVDISRIDRHILMNKFTVDLTYLFLDDPDMQLFSSKYSFEVSFDSCVVDTDSSLIFTGSVLPTRNTLAV